MVESPSCVPSLCPYELQHAGLLCLPHSPGVCSHSCPLSHWCNLTISSSAVPFSFCLQSFPVSESFPMSLLFASVGQSTGTSVLVLPMNILGWFPLELTGFISLQSKGLSRVLSSTKRDAQLFQSCPTLWDSMDCSPPGSNVHGILQARILDWVPMSFSRGSSLPGEWTCISCVSCIAGRFFTHWVTCEAQKKGYWSVILFSCYCIAWFWYQGYTDLRKLVEKSFFFLFLRSICEMNSSVKLWSNSPVSPYIPGLILVIFKRVNIQSLICLFRFSTFSCSLCFLIICPLKSTLYLFLWALFSIFLEFFLCRLIVMVPF